MIQAGADLTAILAGIIGSHLRVYVSDVEVYPEAIELVRALAFNLGVWPVSGVYTHMHSESLRQVVDGEQGKEEMTSILYLR
jgi:hypothetical protein